MLGFCDTIDENGATLVGDGTTGRHGFSFWGSSVKHSGLLPTIVRRLLIVLAFAVGTSGSFVLAGTVAAQDTGLTDDSTYVFGSGQTVEWNAPWSYNEEFSGVDDPLEVVMLDTQMSSVMVATFPNAIDIDQARDLFIEGLTGESETFVSIDKGAYSGLSYSLDLLAISDIEFGAFTLFRAGEGDVPTIASIILSPSSAFGGEFSSAQQNVTLDGEGLFPGVDGSGLQDLLAAQSGQAPDDDPEADVTPEASEETEVTPEDKPDGGDSGNGLKGGSGEANEESTPDGGDTGSTGETGLIDDNTFVSPQYLAEITWDTTYTLDTEREVSNSSDESTGVDFVALTSTSGGTGLLSIQIIGDASTDPAALVEIWQTPDFIADTALSPDDAEVLLADSTAAGGGVVIREFLEDGTELVTYREVLVLEDRGAIAVITYTSLPDYVATGVADAQGGVAIDGEPALDTFTADDILAAL